MQHGYSTHVWVYLCNLDNIPRGARASQPSLPFRYKPLKFINEIMIATSNTAAGDDMINGAPEQIPLPQAGAAPVLS